MLFLDPTNVSNLRSLTNLGQPTPYPSPAGVLAPRVFRAATPTRPGAASR
jgi:hypothetical protein